MIPGLRARTVLALAVLHSLARGSTAAAVPEQAIARMQAGHFEQAAELLRPLVRQAPQDPDLWNLLGVCAAELNDTRSAENAFLKGIQLAPDAARIRENLGLLYFRTRDYAKAKVQLAAAVRSGSVKPEVQFSLAAAEARTGNETKGLSLLRKVEPALSGRAEYWTERGWLELRLDPASAAESFERALAIEPDRPRALNGAASDAEAHGEDEKALSYLVRARKASPGDLRILLHFASVCLRRDLAIDAADALARARSLAPQNNLALFLSAETEISFQHWQKAHDLFSEFDRRVPGYAPAQYAMGWLDRRLNAPDEARAHLERSLKLDPGLVDARCELGELELSEGNQESAESDLRQVLQAKPSHVKAEIAMGDVLMHRADLDGARKFYENAIQKDPESGPAHYRLSTVLFRKQETQEAELERALATRLNEEALRASRTVLRLARPDGQLLSESP